MKGRILYLSYTGMLEPLGRSQVLSYLARLSNEYTFTLVSFEKPVDLADANAVTSLHSECNRQGIDWRPQVYHYRPRLLATAWDLLVLLWHTFRHSFKQEVRLLHCRSYIPAIAAWMCGKLTRKPFIFDMRALWPEEMVTAGRLRRGALTYRILMWVERRLLRRAARVVSLTQAGVDHLLMAYPELSPAKFEVITTCVDVERFHAPASRSADLKAGDRSPFVVGTMGTLLSGWFYLDAFFAFFMAVKRLRPDAVARIVTRDDHGEIFRMAVKAGVDSTDVEVRSALPTEMPELLADMDVGAMFYAPDIGRAPTRLGEFLASGVPVVGNTGIGDLGRLIDGYGVGVVVDDAQNSAALAEAAQDLLGRYDGILASGACRHAAEDYFSADKGAEKYRRVYQALILERGSSGRAEKAP
ncbi:glycosyltransferase [Alloalcanivorax sp. C16-1]|uniref:glycosyltransferase n=1 Tax=Alloalcanivorax sp. C16-1 TaxID=3390051 RepID=UPI0039705DA1